MRDDDALRVDLDFQTAARLALALTPKQAARFRSFVECVIAAAALPGVGVSDEEVGAAVKAVTQSWTRVCRIRHRLDMMRAHANN